MPQKNRRVSNYEDTDLDQAPKVPHKSSSPSPFHDGGLRKHREGSPKIPIPYQSNKQLGLSPNSAAGDGSDGSKRYSSSQHSSTSSLNQLSDDADAYEPIADFLKTTMSASSVPQPDSSLDQSETPSSFNAPSYPAPIPPKKTLETTRIPERFVEEEEGDDDDGYTRVNLEGGQVEIMEYTDSVERAALPLLSSSSTRSSLTGDSTHSSPMRTERQRSPSAPDIGPGISSLSHSLQNQPKFVSTSSGKVAMPPEPTSPPPSPPVSNPRNPTPPIPITAKSPSPLLSQRNVTSDGSRSISPSSSSSQEQQPRLPPKKRNQNLSVSSSVRDDDIYSFDTLNPSILSSSVPKNPAPPPFTQPSFIDDDIYAFDTLEPPPPVPVKNDPRKTTTSFPALSTSSPFQPSYDDDNIYEFDNLEDVPSVSKEDVFSVPKEAVPSIPKKRYSLTAKKTSMSTSSMPQGEDPPPIPRKSFFSQSSASTAPVPQGYQFHDDVPLIRWNQLLTQEV